MKQRDQSKPALAEGVDALLSGTEFMELLALYVRNVPRIRETIENLSEFRITFASPVNDLRTVYVDCASLAEADRVRQAAYAHREIGGLATPENAIPIAVYVVLQGGLEAGRYFTLADARQLVETLRSVVSARALRLPDVFRNCEEIFIEKSVQGMDPREVREIEVVTGRRIERL